MKTRHVILTLLLCAVGAMVGMQARQYEQGEKIYVNTDQTNSSGDGEKFNWSADGANLFLYVWKKGVSGSEKWLKMEKEDGNIYAVTMPSNDWFDRCIIIRKNNSTSTAGWDGNIWNRTCDLDLIDNPSINCIKEFWNGGSGCSGSANWATYSPSPSKVGGYTSAMTAEVVHICANAMGGPFSLHPKLKSDMKDYDYENVQCQAWYMSTNGTTWTNVDDKGGKMRDGDQDKDVNGNVLPNAGTVYYYLHAAKSAGRRLIKVVPDAEGCELDCTITAFEVACSAVNANDTTYTLDGMVAFGEPNGDLVIECDGQQVSISGAKSPQVFSIPGLRGATTSGKTATAIAKFTGNSGCTKDVTFAIPNVTQGIVSTHIDVLAGENVALNPAGANYGNKHIWYVDGEEQASMQGQQSSIVYNEANTTRYTYREFNPPAGDMNDMMSNGSYEEEFDYGTKGNTSTISDYMYWGKYAQTDNTAVNFYTDATVNPSNWKSNGFAVVKNVHNFFYTFASITARDGQYFAMFDAASDGVAGKKAWKAETAKNPNLKLQKGTTYLFSFWAANINNYGEMDNAAKLQFQIEYNGKTQKLGDVLDLGSVAFRNNRWHQCSATFLADADAANVVISVVNLNTNTLPTGNDFALDDIQFRAVSSATRSVRTQQVFEVQTHEPHIYSLKASVQPMACGKTEYDVVLHVSYDNPKGKLVITDTDSGEEVYNARLLPAGTDPDWDKQKTFSHAIHLPSLTPSEHHYEAHFDEWASATATTTVYAPASSDCPPEPVETCENVLYRKWTNVLFVDNHDSVYVAYQWYKNDEAMPGETQQRYYQPSGDLSGTSDTYFCEMLTVGGATVRTCAYTFDAAPRSAEAAGVEALYDALVVTPTVVHGGGEVMVIPPVGGMQLTLLTASGYMLRQQTCAEGTQMLRMPNSTGIYLLLLRKGEMVLSAKITVY